MRRQPNLLVIMVDQLAGTLFPSGPAPFLEVPHLRRLYAEGVDFASDMGAFAITDRHVAASRRAYCANISYIDERIGELLATLEACRFGRVTAPCARASSGG